VADGPCYMTYRPVLPSLFWPAVRGRKKRKPASLLLYYLCVFFAKVLSIFGEAAAALAISTSDPEMGENRNSLGVRG
jgi:hypothetical protein